MGSAVRVSAIRAFWRGAHPPPSLLKRLEPVYYVFFTLVFIGPLFYGTASTALAEVATPHAVSLWGPSLALVGLLAAARWGAVQGPVVFSVPDVAWLLSAPLRRKDLVLWRLVRGLAAGAGGAAIVAGLVLVGVAGDHRGVAADRAAGFVVAIALLGVLGVAAASLVQGSRRWDTATRRAVWPAAAIAVALVAASAPGFALWSGPWGWALQPVASGGAWEPAVALLALLAAAAAGLALARRGAAPTERYVLRAEARGGAVAALYSFDARYARRSFTRVGGGPARTRRLRLPVPRSPGLAVAWRDAVAALRAPQRLGEALLLAAGGAVVCVADAEHTAAVAGGALAIFAGASRLLEPLRAETDSPDRGRLLLGSPLGRTLLRHAALPGAAVMAAAAVAAAGCAAAGALPRHGAAAALLVVAGTPAVTLCAALSSRRGGRLPPSVMAVASTDTSGMGGAIVVAWIAAWPVLGIALGTAPVSSVTRHGTAGLAQLLLLLATATATLAAALRWERFAP
ncbi:hypothetical protein [Candidatus Solirubrobacter pratensis]|uniref:hypothetical protein n=1 Tax=Candidatus Solirubrobacter pratensis TaxID=1298857 RepID=UPI00041F499F|nr:hypothetical protein [Candidatus Solirubrobacter pratensis]